MEVCENMQLMAKGEKPGGSVGYHEMYVPEHLHTPRRAQGMAVKG